MALGQRDGALQRGRAYIPSCETRRLTSGGRLATTRNRRQPGSVRNRAAQGPLRAPLPASLRGRQARTQRQGIPCRPRAASSTRGPSGMRGHGARCDTRPSAQDSARPTGCGVSRVQPSGRDCLIARRPPDDCGPIAAGRSAPRRRRGGSRDARGGHERTICVDWNARVCRRTYRDPAAVARDPRRQGAVVDFARGHVAGSLRGAGCGGRSGRARAAGEHGGAPLRGAPAGCAEERRRVRVLPPQGLALASLGRETEAIAALRWREREATGGPYDLFSHPCAPSSKAITKGAWPRLKPPRRCRSTPRVSTISPGPSRVRAPATAPCANWVASSIGASGAPTYS